jgi:3-oxoacyl-[acyl-carrier-protein] synthase II
MSARRVAITGVGLVTSLGATREGTWDALVAGRCGIGPVTLFETDGYRSRIAGEIRDATVTTGLTPLQRRRWSRSDQFGVVAAADALDDSGVLSNGIDRTRVGVMLGAGTADLLRNERFFFTALDRGIAHGRPSDVWNHFSNTPVDVLAAHFGLEGARSCVVAACSSSTIAIGQALSAIRHNRLDAAIAGGTDSLARLTFSGFNALRLMDPEPCRPFDKARNGMSIGEGAGLLVLEELEHAKQRGAHIYAELAGYGLGCEAFHPTAPEPDGQTVAAVVQQALDDARCVAGDIDHVNAHGTATSQNDRAEARGFRTVFGSRTRDVMVTSVKSMVGHCLGAAGGVEAAVTTLTVARGIVPPTVHFAEPDPDCDLEVVTTAREQRVRCAVSTSLAFGGNDAALVIRELR